MRETRKTRECRECQKEFKIPDPPSHRKMYCSKECLIKSIKRRQKGFREKYQRERDEMSEIERFLKYYPVTEDIFENQMNFLRFIHRLNPEILKDFYLYLKI